MTCRECGADQLAPIEVKFQRTAPDGSAFRMEVPGLRCTKCGTEILAGNQAERISAEWYRVVDATNERALQPRLITGTSGISLTSYTRSASTPATPT